MTNTVTRIGVVFVLLGAIAMLAPMFGLSAVDANRSVQVNAAETPATAYLAISDVYESDNDSSAISRECGGFFVTTCESNEVDAIELRNNADSPFDGVSVEVTSVSGTDDSILHVSNNDELSSLEPDGSPQPVSLECGQGGGSATNAEVTLTIDAPGSDISVSQATYTVSDVTFDCEEDDGAGDGKLTDEPVPIDHPDVGLQLVPGSSEAASPTGFSSNQGDSMVTFELENTGENDVTVRGITVTDASDATHVNMIDDWIQAGNEVTITNEATDTSSTINLEGSLSVSDNRYNLSSSESIANGETVVIDIEQFRDGENGDTYNQVDMQGKSVTLVLYAEGGSSANPDEEIPIEIELDL